MKLTVEHVGCRLGDVVLLDDIEMEIPSGSMIGLVGPNGSGKSTLLRLLSRALAAQTGIVWLDDERLWDLDDRQADRLIGVVPETPFLELDVTVADLVTLGWSPHQRTAGPSIDTDRHIVEDVLARLGLADLGHRRLDELSGGERQRAIVARALVQQPTVLLLDEPTHHLDVRRQHDVLGLVRRLGPTTLVVLADLNLAGAYCDQVVVLSEGRVTAAGPTTDVLVADVIEAAFGIPVTVIPHPSTHRPQLLFHPADAFH